MHRMCKQADGDTVRWEDKDGEIGEEIKKKGEVIDIQQSISKIEKQKKKKSY